jgi:hypothetical protein
MSRETKVCAQIAGAMKDGGYYDAVMSGGRELDRVQQYIAAFAGEGKTVCAYPLQNPGYPCFPGLRHAPFRDDPGAAPGAALLEQSFETIRDEYLDLRDDEWVIYNPMGNRWMVYFFYHMGVDLDALTKRCPKTSKIVKALPRVCLNYPWGDVLFSVHASDAHLVSHCSIDNLRVRCHLGVQVPENCEMRVGTEKRGWEVGKNLLFEDSFEHEVWNRGTTRRAILIVDFWHPDLTDVEIEALTAGFRKSDVRRIFLLQRIQNVSNTKAHIEYLEAAMARQDKEPLIRQYWKR